MSKIIPHLWFDKEAREAADFYCAAFPDSKITQSVILRDTPSGDSELISFQLAGQPFMALSAGPLFKFNPSTSFILNFDPSKGRSKEDLEAEGASGRLKLPRGDARHDASSSLEAEGASGRSKLPRGDARHDASSSLEALWEKLLPGGKVLMALQQYPHAPLYGWLQDRYGVSWQLMLSDSGDKRPFITPALLFVGEVCGKAEEAGAFYASVFEHSGAGSIHRYPAGMEFDKEGTVMYSEFMLGGQWFAAMDSGYKHEFAFNEAISFMVYCDSQEEIDHYWIRLSAVPEAEQCGWLKDRYGLSWQIVPRALDGMMQDPDQGRVARVMQAILQMKKLELAKLQRAYA
jgi:predicted 3-demethylubiquinone-9 3-methyltransferase (glyoxalase superfamily)